MEEYQRQVEEDQQLAEESHSRTDELFNSCSKLSR